jgi:hypothetical protein
MTPRPKSAIHGFRFPERVPRARNGSSAVRERSWYARALPETSALKMAKTARDKK